MRKVSGTFLLAAFLCGCSIKADRSECPCIMSLVLSGNPDEMVTVIAGNSDIDFRGTIFARDGVCESEIPRGSLDMRILCGLNNCTVDNENVIVPEGKEMDEVYAWSGNVAALGETVSVEARMKKQFAFIHIRLVDGDEEPLLYSFLLEGNSCGFDMGSFDPVAGRFSCTVSPVIGEYYRVGVPRQFDDTLILRIWDTGAKIPLGKYISEIGYDWKSESLEDIYVDIDYLRCQVGVIVREWECGAEFSFEI